MYEQVIPYILLLMVATSVCILLAIYAWQRRSTPGAAAFLWMMVAAAVWSLAYALELGSNDLHLKIHWIKAEYLGIVTLPIAWLIFSLQYAGWKKWLTNRNLVLSLIIPAITVLLVWTSQWHEFFYHDISLDSSGSFPVLDLSYSWWFWIHIGYSYLALFLGTYVLGQVFSNASPLYRKQVGVLLAGAVAPWFASALYISRLSPIPNLDLTPFGFTIAGLTMAWGHFRFQLLDVMPAAREIIVESMSDGVIILDRQDRIADMNPAAGRITGIVVSAAVGKPISQVLGGWTEWSTGLQETKESRIEIILDGEGQERYCDLNFLPLYDRRERLTGQLIVLRDITESRLAEMEAHRHSAVVEAINQVFQATFTSTSRSEVARIYLTMAKELTASKVGFVGQLNSVDQMELLAYSLTGEPVRISDSDDNRLFREMLTGRILTQVLQTGTPVLLNNLDSLSDRISFPAWHPSLTSLLALPLRHGGQTIGLIGLANKADGYTDANFRDVETLSMAFVEALNRKQAETRQAHWAEMERILSKASSRFVESQDLDRAINDMLRDTGTVIKTNRAYVFRIYDNATRIDNTHEWVAQGTAPQIENLQELETAALPWWMGKLYANEVIAVSDVGELPSPEKEILQEQKILSVLVLPIFIGSILYGFVGFDDTEQYRRWESEEIGFLRNVIQILGRALERDQAERALQASNAELTALNALAQALAGPFELQQLLDDALLCTIQALDFSGGLIMLADAWRDDLTLSSHTGLPEAFETALKSKGTKGTLCEHVYQNGHPLAVADLDVGAPIDVRGLLNAGLRAYVGTPIMYQGRVLGTMCLFDARSHPISDAELMLLVGIGQQVGLAVENARLFTEARQRVQELELLYRVGQATASGVRIQESLQAAADALASELPEARVAIMLLDTENNQLGMAASVGYPSETVAGLRLALGQGITGWVALHGEPALVPDVSVDSRYYKAAPDTQSELCVPLVAVSQVIGVLSVESPRLSAFDIDDMRLLNTLASNLAVLIERAELFEQVVAARGELQLRAEDLEQANVRLQELDRLKGEFLANMSHEIRTPMNAIIGMTGLLLDTELTAEQNSFVETVRTSGDALLSLINDILDFSKIESGRLELESHPFDLYDCIESSLALIAPEATQKGLELAYHIDNLVPGTVIGDVTRLRQILVNLLSNAVKFTESGEVVVSLSGQYQIDKNYELHFAVRDTGIGIPEHRMTRLFQSFSQVDASTTRRYGGTGLGLVISKNLAEMMGGTMWVDSEIGQGSTFFFTVTVEPTDVPSKNNNLRALPQLTGRKVLIVDDNETNCQILTRQIESWGMVPRAAMSGPIALDWIRQGDTFDIAILDMYMPDMDGLALAAEIQMYYASHRNSCDLPLVMLTSLGQEAEHVSKVSLAASLTKPVKPSQLFNTLVGVFAGQPVKLEESVNQPHYDTGLGQRHPLRILLAEDNHVNQQVALQILKRLGYRADVVANGLEAITALERQSYDVILMDIQMPELDGVEATRRIHARWPAAQRPQIIAMTAHAMKGDRDYYLNAGMDDYVSKPVRVTELIKALLRCQPAVAYSAKEQVTVPVEAIEPVEKTIDRGVFEETLSVMGGEISELITLFFAEAKNLIMEIKTAADAGDTDRLRQAAHGLKSSSANLGAAKLGVLCQQLEALGRAGITKGVSALVSQIEVAYADVKAALEQEC